MKLLLFVCRLKIAALTKGQDNVDGWLRSFFTVVLVIVALLYGVAAGYLFRFLHTRLHLAPDWLMARLSLLMGVMVLLKSYFPENVAFRPIFVSVYPAGIWKKSVIQLCYDLITPFFLLVLLFAGAFCLTAGTVTIGYAFYLTGGVLMFYLLERILKIQQWGKFVPLPTGIAILLPAVIAAITLWLNPAGSVLIAMPFIGCIVMTLLFISIYQQQEAIDGRQRRHLADNREKSFGQLVFMSMIRRKPLRTTLLIGAIFKLFFCGLIAVVAWQNRNHVLTENLFLLAVTCTPLVIFNYVFNNLFGYVPQTYFMIGYIRSPHALFYAYCRGISKIVLVDFIVSLLAGFYIFPAVHTLIFLLFIYLDSILLGFLSSALLPKKVTMAIDFVSFRSNTPIFAGVVLGLLVLGMLYAIDRLPLLLLIQCCFTVATLVIYVNWYKNEKDRVVQSFESEII